MFSLPGKKRADQDVDSSNGNTQRHHPYDEITDEQLYDNRMSHDDVMSPDVSCDVYANVNKQRDEVSCY